MGCSAGKDFKDMDDNEFHLEAKERGVAIWTKDEMKRILWLSKEDAELLAEDLLLHASMVPDKPYIIPSH